MKIQKPIYTVTTWHDHAIHATSFIKQGDGVKANRSTKLAKAKLLNKVTK